MKKVIIPLLISSLFLFGCGTPATTPANTQAVNAQTSSDSQQPDSTNQVQAQTTQNGDDEEDTSGPTGTGLLAGVYHPYRFDILKDSLTVTGVSGISGYLSLVISSFIATMSSIPESPYTPTSVDVFHFGRQFIK